MRQLWNGSFNARDLGGLPTSDGRATIARALVRSDTLSSLTAEGWSALHAYGIRTIIDLQDEDSSLGDLHPRPSDLTTLHLALEDRTATDFWDRWGAATGLYATPLYYRPFLDRFPERCVRVVRAIASAKAGGVVFHCRVGRDRTGLIAMLVLSAVGVPAEAIVADYDQSTQCLQALFAARGEEDEGPYIERILEREGTSARAALRAALAGFDAGAYLRNHGLTEAELCTLNARLVDARQAE